MQYKDKNGKFATFPIPFVEKVIKPNARRHGLSTGEYVEKNHDELVKLLKAGKSELKTNKLGLERIIDKLDKKTKLFIFNGNKKYSCTFLQLKTYLAKVNQLMYQLGYKNINYTYVQLGGFETIIFVLPDARILERKLASL